MCEVNVSVFSIINIVIPAYMNWVLFISLLFLSCFNFLRCNRQILHPSVISSIMFTLSSLMMALNEDNWKWEISIETCFYLIIALIIFTISVNCGEMLYGNRRVKVLKGLADYDKMEIKLFAMTVLSAVCILVTYFYFRHQYEASVQLGNTLGLPGMIFYLRKYSEVGDNADIVKLSTSLNVGISFVRALGWVCIYLVIYKIINKERGRSRYLIPIICLFANLILSTGRGGFICIVSIIAFDIFIIERHHRMKKINKKMLKYSMLLIGLFIPVFFVLGTLTGKDEALNFNDTISIYLGSSILCFDYFITHDWDLPSFFGLHTFRGLYGIIGRFVEGIPFQSNDAEMVRWSGYSSNVYTAFAPYVTDFGLVGSFLVIIISGVIFGYLWRKYLSQQTITLLSIVYGGLFGYALCMLPIAERLFSNYTALNVIVQLIFVKLFLSKLVKKV